MEYGEILARTYQLPQRQQAAPMGVQRQPKERKAEDFDFAKIPGLDKAPEGLEYSRPDIAQQTQRYYQDWAELRNFAKTMWVKYGVDVTAPDPGNQDSIWASEAFNQRLGLLMSGINEAKLGQKAFEERQRLIAEGKLTERPDAVAPQGYSAGYGLEQQYSPVFAESPQVKNIMTGTQNLTPAQVQQANIRIDQTVADFEQQARDAYSRGDNVAGDNFTQQANYARSKQVYAAENTEPRMSAWEFNFGQKQQRGFNELKRVVNHKTGIWENAKESDYFDQNTFWIENRDFEGTDIGSIPVTDPKTGRTSSVNVTIDRAVQNPKTGEIRWVFKESGVPPMRVDNLPVKTVVNYLKGVDLAAVNDFLAAAPQALNERGEVVEDAFIDMATRQKAAQLKGEVTKAVDQSTAKYVGAQKELGGLRTSGFWSWVRAGFSGADSKTYPTRYGNAVITKIGENEFAIENIRELIPALPEGQAQQYEKLTLDQLPSILKWMGAEVDPVTQSAAPNPFMPK